MRTPPLMCDNDCHASEALAGRRSTQDALRQHTNGCRKRLALAIFSSNPISSVAYATEEILLVLSLRVPRHCAWSIPVSLAIILFLVVVLTISYSPNHLRIPGRRRRLHRVATTWGNGRRLIAAAALMIDYVLTVAVSVAAGIAALTSAIPSLFAPPRSPRAGRHHLHYRHESARRAGVGESSLPFPPTVAIGALGLMVVVGTYPDSCSDKLAPVVAQTGHSDGGRRTDAVS